MFKLQDNNNLPKYKQIIQAIKNDIKIGELKQGDQLPSINDIKASYSLARNTIIKAYDELIQKGIVTSKSGKGYYIYKASHEIKHHIFLLFDLFLPYKEILYTSFLNHIGDNALVDISFHHYDKEQYKKLIQRALGQYTDYVIIPYDDDQIFNWFKKVLENQNVYILDLGLRKYGSKYPSVCQDFKQQWYDGLCAIENRIRKYDRIVLKHRAPWSGSAQPHDREMVEGFLKFVEDKNIDSKIISKDIAMEIQKNECYFVTNDDDLVATIKKAREKNFELTKDIGILSHNETPLKSICCWDGISAITTNFEAMGENMAKIVKNREDKHIINPYDLILRKSI